MNIFTHAYTDSCIEPLFRSCYSGTAAAFLVYDVTSRKTFKEVGIWLRDLLMHCEPNTVIMLLGKKSSVWDKWGIGMCTNGVYQV